MNVYFTPNEVCVLLTSLLSRRNTIISLMETIPSYSENLKELEALIERLFPGSLNVMKNNEKVS